MSWTARALAPCLPPQHKGAHIHGTQDQSENAAFAGRSLIVDQPWKASELGWSDTVEHRATVALGIQAH